MRSIRVILLGLLLILSVSVYSEEWKLTNGIVVTIKDGLVSDSDMSKVIKYIDILYKNLEFENVLSICQTAKSNYKGKYYIEILIYEIKSEYYIARDKRKKSNPLELGRTRDSFSSLLSKMKYLNEMYSENDYIISGKLEKLYCGIVDAELNTKNWFGVIDLVYNSSIISEDIRKKYYNSAFENIISEIEKYIYKDYNNVIYKEMRKIHPTFDDKKGRVIFESIFKKRTNYSSWAYVYYPNDYYASNSKGLDGVAATRNQSDGTIPYSDVESKGIIFRQNRIALEVLGSIEYIIRNFGDTYFGPGLIMNISPDGWMPTYKALKVSKIIVKYLNIEDSGSGNKNWGKDGNFTYSSSFNVTLSKIDNDDLKDIVINMLNIPFVEFKKESLF